MNRTKIEWCDYTINPVKGLCPMACSYCYARRMYKRFKWNPEIRFERPHFKMPDKPSTFFVGSTIELFGEWVKPEWLREIFGVVSCHPKHTFIFLTRCPQNLIKWSPFPENCWVGMTITNKSDLIRGHHYLYEVKAKVKFLSIEPLLGRCQIAASIVALYNWLIIGQQTPVSARTAPKIEWIREIVEAADKAGIPVFLKDNLMQVFKPEYEVEHRWAFKMGSLRQELPV